MSDQPEKRESLPGLPRRSLYRDIEPAAIGAPTWAGKVTKSPVSVTPPVTNVTAAVTDVTPNVTPEPVRLLSPSIGRLPRLATGKALTPAEKQARYRERKKLTEADIRRALEGKPLP